MDDRAESETIAIVLFIALAVGLSGALLVWVNGMGEDHAAPQVPFLESEDLEDTPCTTGTSDDLFTLQYNSGIPFRWDDFEFQVLDGTTDHASVIDWGSGAGVLPTGMTVGDTLTASETTNICTTGALESWKVRIIQPAFQNSIVYEQVIAVR